MPNYTNCKFKLYVVSITPLHRVSTLMLPLKVQSLLKADGSTKVIIINN